MDADSDDELLGLVDSPRSTDQDIQSSKIEMTPPPSPSHSRQYLKLSPISNVNGYVVQVHDATNFDIDLDLSPHLLSRYTEVISNEYQYKTTSDPAWYSRPQDAVLTERVGKTYRCRLRGVGLNPRVPYAAHSRRALDIKEEIRKLFDRADGWCSCTVSDVDVYSRLLIDVVLKVEDKSIKLKDYLLNMMMEPRWNDLPIYSHYSK